MRTVAAATTELAELLRGHGMPADTDPSRLSPDPTRPVVVWIEPREIRPETRDGGTLVAWCYLVTGNGEVPDVMGRLDAGLAQLLALIDPADTDPVINLTSAVVLPTNPNPLPGYRVAVDLDL